MARQPHQTTPTALHTSFRLEGEGGSRSVVLSRFISGAIQTVDYLNYTSLQNNYSYRDAPDGQPFYRESMFRASPAGTNNSELPPVFNRFYQIVELD